MNLYPFSGSGFARRVSRTHGLLISRILKGETLCQMTVSVRECLA